VTPHRLLVRPPAVAGSFYPAEPNELRVALDTAIAGAVPRPPQATAPGALVVPHAGYVYSGSVAASAYLRAGPVRRTVRRVVLLGPSHRVPLRGLAMTSADAWASPLGLVPIDGRGRESLRDLPWVTVNDRAHAPEHSLEVQLPFLQTVFDDFVLVPLVVGAATNDEVAAVIDPLWTGPDTIVVVSTDLSHYHRYCDAVRLDERTARAIVDRRFADIDDHDACGARPLRGLLQVAFQRDLAVEMLDVRNSGETAGDRERVVGYGAFAVA
jgi:AmmeMemoRadiSam system protein B